jgi:hypothetical protein
MHFDGEGDFRIKIKREHGAAYPIGTKTVAAPATVSGELFRRMPLAKEAGKARRSVKDVVSQETCQRTEGVYAPGNFTARTEGVRQ